MPGSFRSRESHFTTEPPEYGVDKLVIRIFNPTATGVDKQYRVQNEVASMHVIRMGLARAGTGLEKIIPDIYGWGAERFQGELNTNIGWILMEHKEGTPGGTPTGVHMENLSDQRRSDIMKQLAEILSYIQRSPLPPTAPDFGGLNILTNGDIISSAMTTVEGGPWKSYTDFCVDRIRSGITKFQTDPRTYQFREKFPSSNIDRLSDLLGDRFPHAHVDIGHRTMIHGALRFENMLFSQNEDTQELEITALLDFERAGICHPSQEFIWGLEEVGGNIANFPSTSGFFELLVIDAIVSGRFENMSSIILSNRETALRLRAFNWNSFLMAAKAMRPATIPGMADISQVARLISRIYPPCIEGYGRISRRQYARNYSFALSQLKDCLGYFEILGTDEDGECSV
ncbi:hypothetical protein F5Y04DRAFT_288252 [Hypomontagnella monticulosa]|nr:hypothetical protein F5Y04DRAFT_288252 [Hypomontagnella monticulosa]